ncbi:hypothetical protein L226DRAFT_607854 [Lentinus tigrinus ALCF2SS1-7]|uniref:Uncharacterized protein n=1 Tax=Lentinus tigrinus ALCF2SS1-6 TaxID=1328759 RepID=A0A5C2STS2_9APHY|nr:hypothetical protein L227DRAFT_649881 [Lentinus tigrinus ALCF2SS1-6]RPD82792.1 hypothetical protein L226DRAFT_607854 [Lentinus tigrinus ALCF2SS1-7]
MSSGAMQSNVGNPQIYNDGDQRYSEADRRAEIERRKSELSEGQKNAHDIHDPKDNRNLEIRAKQEAVQERQAEREERQQTVTNPLEPAQRHGNEPSRGAQIDAELQAEDEEMLRKKGPYNGTSH